LDCSGEGGSTSKTISIDVVPTPTVQLSADWTLVAIGQPITVNWTTSNATTCIASGSWSGSRPSSGTETIVISSSPATFSLDCSGVGGSASADLVVNGVTPAGSGTLADDVLVLDAGQLHLIASASDSQITFAGDVPISVGQVFITDTTAYKAAAVHRENGQTIVAASAPGLEEVFAKLDIKGTFPFDPSQLLTADDASQSKNAQLAKARAVDGRLETTYSLSGGGLTSSVQLALGYVIDVDVHWDKQEGTPPSASLQAHADYSQTVTAAVATDVPLFEIGPIKIADARIPIPVTVVDRFLNLIGIRLASIYVPVRAGATGNAVFEYGLEIQTSGAVSVTAAYSPEKGLSGTAGVETPFSTTLGIHTVDPSNEPTSIPVDLSLLGYLSIAPSLAILDTVAMIGVETKFEEGLKGTARMLFEEDPPYCIEGYATWGIKTAGFFKSADFSLHVPLHSEDGGRSSTKTWGTCKLGTELTVSVDAENPEVFEAMEVSVQLAPTNVEKAGDKGPRGTVTVSLGSESCIAEVDENGAGTCTIYPQATGIQQINAEYEGNEDFEGASATYEVTIAKASTSTQLTASPNQTRVGSPIAFSFSVSPESSHGTLPTGKVTVRDLSGNTLCSATLTPTTGYGQCNFTPLSPGTLSAKAVYGGDLWFATSTSDAKSITVADREHVTQTYTFSHSSTCHIGADVTCIGAGSPVLVTLPKPDPTIGELVAIRVQTTLAGSGTFVCRHVSTPLTEGRLFCRADNTFGIEADFGLLNVNNNQIVYLAGASGSADLPEVELPLGEVGAEVATPYVFESDISINIPTRFHSMFTSPDPHQIVLQHSADRLRWGWWCGELNGEFQCIEAQAWAQALMAPSGTSTFVLTYDYVKN
jgi:hypothetical protein